MKAGETIRSHFDINNVKMPKNNFHFSAPEGLTHLVNGGMVGVKGGTGL